MSFSGTGELRAGAPASIWTAAGRARAPATGADACRLLDVALAIAALALLWPLMLLIAVGIKVQDGGPILFAHRRVGRGGKAFLCWKFRSMVEGAEARLPALLSRDPVAQAEWAADHKLRRDPRVTHLGRLLRSTSMDELPQLLNVLVGDMSLVGPRPIVPAEVERYGRWFRHYAALRPGITGLWQVSGRNDINYRRRIALDVLYARRRTTALYLGILGATAPAVAWRHGSY